MMPARIEYVPGHKVMEGLLDMSEARTQIEEFYQQHKRLPKDAAEGELAGALGGFGRLKEVRYRDGELTGVLTNITPELEGKILVLSAKTDGHKLEWTCYSRGIPERDVPKSCPRQ